MIDYSGFDRLICELASKHGNPDSAAVEGARIIWNAATAWQRGQDEIEFAAKWKEAADKLEEIIASKKSSDDSVGAKVETSTLSPEPHAKALEDAVCFGYGAVLIGPEGAEHVPHSELFKAMDKASTQETDAAHFKPVEITPLQQRLLKLEEALEFYAEFNQHKMVDGNLMLQRNSEGWVKCHEPAERALSLDPPDASCQKCGGKFGDHAIGCRKGAYAQGDCDGKA